MELPLEGPGELSGTSFVFLFSVFPTLVNRTLSEGEGPEEEKPNLPVMLIRKKLSLNLACSELKMKSTIV